MSLSCGTQPAWKKLDPSSRRSRLDILDFVLDAQLGPKSRTSKAPRLASGLLVLHIIAVADWFRLYHGQWRRG
ncbi:hypothetical protein VTI28DRAFT_10402 [Corynascus sepedonium]